MVCSHKANKPCFMLSGIPIPAPSVKLSPVTCCRINHIIVINLYKDYRLSKLLPVDCFWERRKCITINFKCFGNKTCYTFSILIKFSLLLLSAFCLFLLIFLFILIWNFSNSSWAALVHTFAWLLRHFFSCCQPYTTSAHGGGRA
jgi:hypothetical protein